MRRFLTVGHVTAAPIALVSMFAVELAALALLAGAWFICAVLFAVGSPL